MFAHFQVLVHLDGFRNLDLFHQGEYAIGVRVYSETTNRAARPTKFIEKSNAHVTQPLASGSPAYSGGINDEDSSFRCSSFYIRYREETHQINEAVTFDVELPVPNDFVFEPCVLQFELLFQKPNKARALGAQDGPPTLNRLLQVATHKFRFLPSQQGCFGHCHLTFDDMHTCIVEAYACCVLSCFTAGRCELLPRMFIPPEPEKKKGKKGKEEEVPPPVVGTFTGNPNFLACETGGKSFPPLLTGLENEERRYVNSKDGLTERSGRSDASSTSSSSTGSKNAGGKTTSESSDRFPSVAETNLDFVMQCLSALSRGELSFRLALREIAGMVNEEEISRTPAGKVLSECLANDQQRRSLILRDAAHQVREEAKTSGEGKALLLASAGAFKRMTEEVLKLWLAFFDVFPEIAPAFMVSTEVSSARILQDRFEETTFTEEVESCIHFDSSRSMRAHDALVRRHRKRGKGGWKQSPFEDISCKIDENNGVLIFRQVQDGNRRRGEEGGGGGVGGISGGGGGGGGGRIPRTESGSERIFDYKRAGVSTEMFGDLSRMLQESGIRSPSSQEGPKTQVHVHKALLQATRGVDWSPSNAGRGEHAEEVERLSPHGRADQGEQEEVDGESLAAEICSSPHFKMKPNLSPTPGGPEGGIGRGGSSSSGSSNCPPRFFAAELKTMSQLRGGNETLEDGMHLYVFAHGFQGNQYDLRMLKNHMADLFPNADFLLSSANENDTYSDIQTLGANLAQEVDRHISQMIVPLGRLSFIGHSLGGIISRAALAHPTMRKYRDKMYTYCSLGSAHLGYQYSDNSIVDGGMWFLKKLKNSTSLHQFSLTDSKNPLTTFMYRLSEAPTLQFFKNVLFVASPQDGYAPFYSARVEVHARSLKDTKHGSVHLSMINNILRPLQESGSNVMRFEVHFNVQGKGLDGTIKRAAHIMLLDSFAFIRHFIAINRHLFE